MAKYLLINIVLIYLLAFPVFALDFNISVPTEAELAIPITASISGMTRSYYLQAGIRRLDTPYYFGETENLQNNWTPYTSSPDPGFITANFLLAAPTDASWSGIINFRFDNFDPNYHGPGLYELKVFRYTGASSSAAGDSSEAKTTINLTASTPTPSPSPSPSPSPTPTPSPSIEPSPLPSPSLAPSPPPSSFPSPSLDQLQEGTVAGLTDPDLSAFKRVSPPPSSAPQNSFYAPGLNLRRDRLQTVFLIGTGLILTATAGFFGYRKYLRSRTIQA